MAQQQVFNIETLWQEAQTRWLKPAEVLFILQNYERLKVTQEPPNRPPSGSLFLFNRRILRFFRKDGYMWRKKKDGRTVGEAHERLKVGNVDALNCYYAHGEQNPYFQRRSFWMLDPAHDNIVLVHYREVAEGRYVSGTISNLSNESPSIFNQSTSISNAHQVVTAGTGEIYQNSFSPSSVEEVSSKFVLENFEVKQSNISDRLEIPGQSTQPEVNKAIRKLAEQLSLGDDINDSFYFEDNPPAYSVENGSSHDLGTFTYEQSKFYREPHESLQSVELRGHAHVIGSSKEMSYPNAEIALVPGNYGIHQCQPLSYDYGTERNDSASWTDMLNLSSCSAGTEAHGRNNLASDNIPETSKFPHHLLSSSQWMEDSAIPFEKQEKLPCYKAEDKSKYHVSSASDLRQQLSATRRFLLDSESSFDSPTSISLLKEVQEKHLSGKKASELNIRKEIGSDWIGNLPMSVGNSSYLPEFSSTWFDQNQFEMPIGIGSSLTLSQKQQFSIREISPEWAFTSESTKVIITGDFLCNPKECTWAVMFGDTEVPIEIVQEGVLRCQTPPYSAGKVTLCITTGNRESCSEIRDFEFRSNPNTSKYFDNKAIVDTVKSSEQLLLLSKFVQSLLCDHDSSVVLGGINESGAGDSSKLKTTDASLQQIIEALSSNESNDPIDIMDRILQELLKDKLQNWLSSKLKHNERTGCLLTKQDQGIIHLISGLGYEWALAPILDAGVGINFRDTNGWTALHWAAHCGRETMVAALLAAEASAGLVTDPTPQDPVGKTPAFLASARGHMGLAGYLSEVALTSHLSSLTMEENEISKVSAEVEAERAVENVSQRSVEVRGGTEDELSLKDSLAAVRNVAQAAARIQSAFRAHSFRKRQQKLALSRDEYGMTQGDIQGLSAASRSFAKFDKAAVSIQKKYRGWKGRKDFLTLRQHVVKIQAHVRGHQVRKKYKEFIWTVSIVEKVILRWRRKGVGLRGFKAEPDMVEEDEEEEEDIAKVFRKQKVDDAIEEAVSRVLSMVDSPEARQQYRRMLERYRQAKAELGSWEEATSRLQGDIATLNDDFIY